MARTATITDHQIIEAAREAFLELGYGAPSSEIARRANVSEGTIFKRFHTKDELFMAAVVLPDGDLWFDQAQAMIGQGDLRQNLLTLGLEIFRTTREVLPRMMMVLSRGNAPMPRPDSPMDRAILSLTQLFTSEIELGRMRAMNPEVAALMLLGAIMHRVQLEVMFATPVLDHEALVQDVVDGFWHGIAPSQNLHI